MTLARLHGRTHQFVEEKVAAITRGLGPAHVLGLCAVVPLVVLPPLVALIAAVTAMRRTSDQPPAVKFEWIAIVSAVNLIVSGLVLYKFHMSPTEVFGFAGAAARAALRFLFGIFPGIPSTPCATPV